MRLTKPKILQIKEFVALKYNVSIDALSASGRADFQVIPRWVAMTVCNELGLNHGQIGRVFKRNR